MEPAEIEAWTQRIVGQLGRGSPIEDSRVELKSDWLDPQPAARRIAGHANSARGSTVLWIVGLDEKAGVVGVKGRDFAIWWPQVQAEFNELAPSVIDLVVPVQGKEVVALVIDTVRAPFVVKNPAHGNRGGGPVSREVPWREGTSTRSATRTDLVTLLVPLLRMPTFEILSGSLRVSKVQEQKSTGKSRVLWRLQLDVYIGAALDRVVVIPDHQCSGELSFASRGRTVSFSTVKVVSRETGPWSPYRLSFSGMSHQPIRESQPAPVRHTIQQGVSQLIVSGPGPAKIYANAEADDADMVDFIDVPSVEIDIKLRPVGATVPVTLTAELRPVSEPKSDMFGDAIAEWSYGG